MEGMMKYMRAACKWRWSLVGEEAREATCAFLRAVLQWVLPNVERGVMKRELCLCLDDLFRELLLSDEDATPPLHLAGSSQGGSNPSANKGDEAMEKFWEIHRELFHVAATWGKRKKDRLEPMALMQTLLCHAPEAFFQSRCRALLINAMIAECRSSGPHRKASLATVTSYFLEVPASYLASDKWKEVWREEASQLLADVFPRRDALPEHEWAAATDVLVALSVHGLPLVLEHVHRVLASQRCHSSLKIVALRAFARLLRCDNAAMVRSHPSTGALVPLVLAVIEDVSNPSVLVEGLRCVVVAFESSGSHAQLVGSTIAPLVLAADARVAQEAVAALLSNIKFLDISLLRHVLLTLIRAMSKQPSVPADAWVRHLRQLATVLREVTARTLRKGHAGMYTSGDAKGTTFGKATRQEMGDSSGHRAAGGKQEQGEEGDRLAAALTWRKLRVMTEAIAVLALLQSDHPVWEEVQQLLSLLSCPELRALEAEPSAEGAREGDASIHARATSTPAAAGGSSSDGGATRQQHHQQYPQSPRMVPFLHDLLLWPGASGDPAVPSGSMPASHGHDVPGQGGWGEGEGQAKVAEAVREGHAASEMWAPGLQGLLQQSTGRLLLCVELAWSWLARFYMGDLEGGKGGDSRVGGSSSSGGGGGGAERRSKDNPLGSHARTTGAGASTSAAWKELGTESESWLEVWRSHVRFLCVVPRLLEEEPGPIVGHASSPEEIRARPVSSEGDRGPHPKSSKGSWAAASMEKLGSFSLSRTLSGLGRSTGGDSPAAATRQHPLAWFQKSRVNASSVAQLLGSLWASLHARADAPSRRSSFGSEDEGSRPPLSSEMTSFLSSLRFLHKSCLPLLLLELKRFHRAALDVGSDGVTGTSGTRGRSLWKMRSTGMVGPGVDVGSMLASGYYYNDLVLQALSQLYARLTPDDYWTGPKVIRSTLEEFVHVWLGEEKGERFPSLGIRACRCAATMVGRFLVFAGSGHAKAQGPASPSQGAFPGTAHPGPVGDGPRKGDGDAGKRRKGFLRRSVSDVSAAAGLTIHEDLSCSFGVSGSRAAETPPSLLDAAVGVGNGAGAGVAPRVATASFRPASQSGSSSDWDMTSLPFFNLVFRLVTFGFRQCLPSSRDGSGRSLGLDSQEEGEREGEGERERDRDGGGLLQAGLSYRSVGQGSTGSGGEHSVADAGSFGCPGDATPPLGVPRPGTAGMSYGGPSHGGKATSVTVAARAEAVLALELEVMRALAALVALAPLRNEAAESDVLIFLQTQHTLGHPPLCDLTVETLAAFLQHNPTCLPIFVESSFAPLVKHVPSHVPEDARQHLALGFLRAILNCVKRTPQSAPQGALFSKASTTHNKNSNDNNNNNNVSNTHNLAWTEPAARLESSPVPIPQALCRVGAAWVHRGRLEMLCLLHMCSPHARLRQVAMELLSLLEEPGANAGVVPSRLGHAVLPESDLALPDVYLYAAVGAAKSLALTHPEHTPAVMQEAARLHRLLPSSLHATVFILARPWAANFSRLFSTPAHLLGTLDPAYVLPDRAPASHPHQEGMSEGDLSRGLKSNLPGPYFSHAPGTDASLRPGPRSTAGDFAPSGWSLSQASPLPARDPGASTPPVAISSLALSRSLSLPAEDAAVVASPTLGQAGSPASRMKSGGGAGAGHKSPWRWGLLTRSSHAQKDKKKRGGKGVVTEGGDPLATGAPPGSEETLAEGGHEAEAEALLRAGEREAAEQNGSGNAKSIALRDQDGTPGAFDPNCIVLPDASFSFEDNDDGDGEGEGAPRGLHMYAVYADPVLHKAMVLQHKEQMAAARASQQREAAWKARCGAGASSAGRKGEPEDRHKDDDDGVSDHGLARASTGALASSLPDNSSPLTLGSGDVVSSSAPSTGQDACGGGQDAARYASISANVGATTPTDRALRIGAGQGCSAAGVASFPPGVPDTGTVSEALAADTVLTCLFQLTRLCGWPPALPHELPPLWMSLFSPPAQSGGTNLSPPQQAPPSGPDKPMAIANEDVQAASSKAAFSSVRDFKASSKDKKQRLPSRRNSTGSLLGVRGVEEKDPQQQQQRPARRSVDLASPYDRRGTSSTTAMPTSALAPPTSSAPTRRGSARGKKFGGGGGGGGTSVRDVAVAAANSIRTAAPSTHMDASTGGGCGGSSHDTASSVDRQLVQLVMSYLVRTPCAPLLVRQLVSAIRHHPPVPFPALFGNSVPRGTVGGADGVAQREGGSGAPPSWHIWQQQHGRDGGLVDSAFVGLGDGWQLSRDGSHDKGGIFHTAIEWDCNACDNDEGGRERDQNHEATALVTRRLLADGGCSAARVVGGVDMHRHDHDHEHGHRQGHGHEHGHGHGHRHGPIVASNAFNLACADDASGARERSALSLCTDVAYLEGSLLLPHLPLLLHASLVLLPSAHRPQPPPSSSAPHHRAGDVGRGPGGDYDGGGGGGGGGGGVFPPTHGHRLVEYVVHSLGVRLAPTAEARTRATAFLHKHFSQPAPSRVAAAPSPAPGHTQTPRGHAAVAMGTVSSGVGHATMTAPSSSGSDLPPKSPNIGGRHSGWPLDRSHMSSSRNHTPAATIAAPSAGPPSHAGLLSQGAAVASASTRGHATSSTAPEEGGDDGPESSGDLDGDFVAELLAVLAPHRPWLAAEWASLALGWAMGSADAEVALRSLRLFGSLGCDPGTLAQLQVARLVRAGLRQGRPGLVDAALRVLQGFAAALGLGGGQGHGRGGPSTITDPRGGGKDAGAGGRGSTHTRP
eukprot:jgi/Mesvir1/28307/Mv04827-RA.1